VCPIAAVYSAMSCNALGCITCCHIGTTIARALYMCVARQR